MNFEALFREHLDYVWRLARVLVGDAAADDVAQEVFLVARRNLREFDGRSARGWLYRITRNVVRNHKRGNRRRLRVVAALPDPPPPPGPDDVLDQERAAEFIDEFLRRPTPVKREAFMLHVIEGLTAAEVAEAVGVPTRTIYSRVRAAKAELEAHVARRGREGVVGA